MNCKHCKAQWTAPANDSLSKCPFCAKPLVDPTELGNEARPEAILQKVVERFDVEIIGNKRLAAILSDFMPHIERRYKHIFAQAVQDGIGAKLLDLKDEDEAIRTATIHTLKSGFRQNKGFDHTADYVVDCFLYAMGWLKEVEEPKLHADINPLNLISQQVELAFADKVLSANEAGLLFQTALTMGVTEEKMVEIIDEKIKEFNLKPANAAAIEIKNGKNRICSTDWMLNSEIIKAEKKLEAKSIDIQVENRLLSENQRSEQHQTSTRLSKKSGNANIGNVNKSNASNPKGQNNNVGSSLPVFYAALSINTLAVGMFSWFIFAKNEISIWQILLIAFFMLLYLIKVILMFIDKESIIKPDPDSNELITWQFIIICGGFSVIVLPFVSFIFLLLFISVIFTVLLWRFVFIYFKIPNILAALLIPLLSLSLFLGAYFFSDLKFTPRYIALTEFEQQKKSELRAEAIEVNLLLENRKREILSLVEVNKFEDVDLMIAQLEHPSDLLMKDKQKNKRFFGLSTTYYSFSDYWDKKREEILFFKTNRFLEYLDFRINLSLNSVELDEAINLLSSMQHYSNKLMPDKIKERKYFGLSAEYYSYSEWWDKRRMELRNAIMNSETSKLPNDRRTVIGISDRIYLHNQPDRNSRRNAYFIKGQKANILHKNGNNSNDEFVFVAFDYNGRITEGYILKSSPAEAIIESIRAVHRGTSVLQTEIARRLSSSLCSGKENTLSQSGLSPRELEILTLIAEGLSNKEIAGRLNLSDGTVRNYISDMLLKLKVRDRTQLAIFYYRSLS